MGREENQRHEEAKDSAHNITCSCPHLCEQYAALISPLPLLSPLHPSRRMAPPFPRACPPLAPPHPVRRVEAGRPMLFPRPMRQKSPLTPPSFLLTPCGG